jgi:hypothetical protein
MPKHNLQMHSFTIQRVPCFYLPFYRCLLSLIVHIRCSVCVSVLCLCICVVFVYRESKIKFSMQNNLKRCSQREWEKENQHALTAVESTPSKHKRFRFSEVERIKALKELFNILCEDIVTTDEELWANLHSVLCHDSERYVLFRAGFINVRVIVNFSYLWNFRVFSVQTSLGRPPTLFPTTQTLCKCLRFSLLLCFKVASMF